MTGPDMTGPAHLDAAQLTALVDGRADPAAAAHAADCGECTRRLDAWRRARRVLAEPAVAPAERRAAAIAAALAVFDAAPGVEAGGTAEGNGAPGTASAASGRTVPGRTGRSGRTGPDGAVRPGGTTPGRGPARPRRARGRWKPQPGTVAAGILVALVAGGITAAAEVHPHSSSKSSTIGKAAGPAYGKSASNGASAGGPTTAASAARGSGIASAPGPGVSAPGITMAPVAAGPVAALGRVADAGSLTRLLRARARSATRPPAGLACAAAAATAAGRPGTTVPEFEATATYAHVPAHVFVFGPVHPVGVAMAAADCRLLARVDL